MVKVNFLVEEQIFEICLTRHYVVGDIRNENIAGVFLKVLVFMYHLFSYNRNLFKSSDWCIIFFSLKKTFENYKICFLFQLYISLKKNLVNKRKKYLRYKKNKYLF